MISASFQNLRLSQPNSSEHPKAFHKSNHGGSILHGGSATTFPLYHISFAWNFSLLFFFQAREKFYLQRVVVKSKICMFPRRYLVLFVGNSVWIGQNLLNEVPAETCILSKFCKLPA